MIFDEEMEDDDDYFPLNQEEISRKSPSPIPGSSPELVSSPIEVSSSPEIRKPATRSLVNDDNSLTEQGLKELSSNVTCDFLEVAIHQILYFRKLYPKGIFAKRKRYEVPVFIAWHPGLRDYIADVVKSLKPLIAEDTIRRVVVQILSNEEPCEKFVFEINNSAASGKVSEDQYLINVELSLRDALLRLSTYDAQFEYDPRKSRFEVIVHVQGGSAANLIYEPNPNLKWVREDDGEPQEEKLVPLKSITESPYLKMQLFVLQTPNTS